jgi:hypothetical protein
MSEVLAWSGRFFKAARFLNSLRTMGEIQSSTPGGFGWDDIANQGALTRLISQRSRVQGGPIPTTSMLLCSRPQSLIPEPDISNEQYEWQIG